MLEKMGGLCATSGRRSIFRLGVKGSGSVMALGYAERMRLRSWMQFSGMTLQNERW